MSTSSNKLTFKNRDGVELAGRLDRPVGPVRGCALFAHCFTCSKDIPAAVRISAELAERGIAVFRFDFTGLGGSGGEFENTNFSSNVDDLVDAAEFLAHEHGGPQLLVGHSLGGAAVLAAARRVSSVRAVATIAAPSDPGHVRHLLTEDIDAIEAHGVAPVDIAGRQFRIRKQFLDDLDSQKLGEELGALRSALLVMHSPVDRIVSIEHAERIYKSARGVRSFVSLDDADHLLTRRQDAEYVAEVLAAWSSRWLGEREAEKVARPERGEVLVRERHRPYTTDVVTEHHRLTADEPAKVGGADEGPNPYELLLGALGACTTMTLRMYADRKGWPLEGTEVRLKHSKIHASECEACESDEGQVDSIQRTIRIDGAQLDSDQRARLLEIADRCPVHRTLTSETVISTTAVD